MQKAQQSLVSACQREANTPRPSWSKSIRSSPLPRPAPQAAISIRRIATALKWLRITFANMNYRRDWTKARTRRRYLLATMAICQALCMLKRRHNSSQGLLDLEELVSQIQKIKLINWTRPWRLNRPGVPRSGRSANRKMCRAQLLVWWASWLVNKKLTWTTRWWRSSSQHKVEAQTIVTRKQDQPRDSMRTAQAVAKTRSTSKADRSKRSIRDKVRMIPHFITTERCNTSTYTFKWVTRK